MGEPINMFHKFVDLGSRISPGSLANDEAHLNKRQAVMVTPIEPNFPDPVDKFLTQCPTQLSQFALRRSR